MDAMTDIEQTECDLLPCPWCGEELREASVSEGSTFRWRKVDGCCADGPEVRHNTMADDQAAAEVESRQKAIAAWNRRAPSRDAERLDWMKPGFRYLASDHVEQVMWPDENGKVTNQVNVSKGSGVRAAIDAAINATNQEDQ